MKKFNKQIKVTVELDAIAHMLHSVMNHEFTHVDSVVEAIIGRLDANNDETGMTLLYNSLHGHVNDVDFCVHNVVICTEKVYAFWTEESKKDRNTVQREIGEARIIGINPFADKKLTIEYNKPNYDGTSTLTRIAVHHNTCRMNDLKPKYTV